MKVDVKTGVHVAPSNLAVLLVAALVVIAMITTELTDFSFSLF